ncbi:MAG: DUF4298 domain-containing protein [Alcaligenaceae bacterium]|nr:DUF4298 domain-containing protein [Alcaligenaceae bacterium]
MSNDNQKSLEQLRRIFSEMDVRTRQAEQDLEQMQQLITRFEAIEENRKALENYYLGEWMDDVDAYEVLRIIDADKQDPEEHFYCTSQDAIWNAAQDLYAERIKLLKLLAESL